MNTKNGILIGYSGHAFVVAEALELRGITLLGYADQKPSEINPFKLSFLGSELAEDFEYWNTENLFYLGIGDNQIRQKVAKMIAENNGICATILHPNSHISKYVEIGEGTFVARSVAINPLCKIGKYVIINTSASIDHECRIGDGVHIAPGAVLAGNVKVRQGSFIGANAVIKQGVEIGENVTIGAGAVVLKNIASNLKVVGNPARVIG